jgi:pilus assembly protein CpaB
MQELRMKPAPPAPDRTRPAFNNRRAWVFGLVSVLLGIAVALLARQYLKDRVAQQTEATNSSKSVQVLVASKSLPKGATLSTDNVSVRSIPAAYRHSQALDPASFDKVDGRKLAFPLQAGEAVFIGLVQRATHEAFSAQVEPGRRAVTMPVDEISSISGLLEPGDRIDLLASVSSPTAGARREVILLLQNSKVMATGQRSTDDTKTGETKRFSTVTLDLSIDEASRLIKARDDGRLTAMLRNRNDHEQLPPMESASTREPAPARTPVRSANATHPTRQGIPVIYGNNSGGSSITNPMATAGVSR